MYTNIKKEEFLNKLEKEIQKTEVKCVWKMTWKFNHKGL